MRAGPPGNERQGDGSRIPDLAGAPVPIREARAAAARMVEAREALRAKVLQAQTELARANEPAAQARLAEMRHQYDVVREGAKEALVHLAAAIAQTAASYPA